MLKLDRITKSFGDKTVLEEFSAEFPEGSHTVIVGSSGSGKTTLLRIISGLEAADSGNVLLPEGTRTSFMFQEPRLFPWISVLENVTSVLQKADHDTASSLLSELGLGSELDSTPSELSGGMKRRVALARSLIFPADLYLFDEPFAGLDPDSARLAANVIFKHTVGKTVIIVSHDRSMLSSDINTITIERRY